MSYVIYGSGMTRYKHVMNSSASLASTESSNSVKSLVRSIQLTKLNFLFTHSISNATIDIRNFDIMFYQCLIVPTPNDRYQRKTIRPINFDNWFWNGSIVWYYLFQIDQQSEYLSFQNTFDCCILSFLHSIQCWTWGNMHTYVCKYLNSIQCCMYIYY